MSSPKTRTATGGGCFVGGRPAKPPPPVAKATATEAAKAPVAAAAAEAKAELAATCGGQKAAAGGTSRRDEEAARLAQLQVFNNSIADKFKAALLTPREAAKWRVEGELQSKSTMASCGWLSHVRRSRHGRRQRRWRRGGGGGGGDDHVGDGGGGGGGALLKGRFNRRTENVDTVFENMEVRIVSEMLASRSGAMPSGGNRGSGGGGGGGGGRTTHQQLLRTETVDQTFDRLEIPTVAATPAATGEMSESEYNDDLDADEELVGNAPAQKNLRGVVIAVVVIVSILALIGAAILWLTPRTDELHLGEPITFTEAMSMMRKMRQLRYQWLSCSKRGATADVLVYLNASSGDIMQASFDQNNDTVSVSRLLSKDQFSEVAINDAMAALDILSPREIVKLCLFKVVLKRGVQRTPSNTILLKKSLQIYRHSSSAFYKLVALPKAPGQRITEKSLCPEGNCEVNPARLRAVQWGSDGAFVAFVFDNNIYYSEKPFEEPAVKITNSPLDPAITVGTCNWVYEEEILESSDAFWVSPGDERIAYLVFNDSAVQAYRMPWYGSPTNMYIQQRGVPYPKAGSRTPLTEVSLRVYDIASRRTIELSKPMAVPQEHYVTLVRWFNSTHLIVGWVNRNQDRGFLGVCDLGTASATATCR
uniref:DPPIV_N domain-containing protein n=1 Tax=Macrostomum lignano TaxID=282301 RepID=A0A1I8I163_9PLAT